METDQVLDQLLERMTDLVDRSDATLAKIEKDVAELKDSRYRPYFTSMGAFLVIVVGVMSYVYSLESRLNAHLLTISSDLAVTQQDIRHMENRLQIRTSNITDRWNRHDIVHQRMDVSNRIMVNRLLDSGALTTPLDLPLDKKGESRDGH